MENMDPAPAPIVFINLVVFPSLLALIWLFYAWINPSGRKEDSLECQLLEVNGMIVSFIIPAITLVTVGYVFLQFGLELGEKTNYGVKMAALGELAETFYELLRKL